MDDKRKRELSAAVERGLDDAAMKKLVANDAQAKAYFDGLVAVDRALRAWPVKESTGVDAFVDSVLARLDESPRDEFDPLAAPFADEREPETPRRNHSEHQAMSQSKDQDNEDDLEGLAALMRPSRTGSSASVPPPPVSVRPGPALTDDAMDESSGIVDIKHLAAIAKRASIPPASEAPAKSEAAEPAAEAKADAKKADEAVEAKDVKKADAKADAKKGDAKKSDAKDAKKGDKAEAGAAKKSAESTEKKAQPVPAATASEPAETKKPTSPVVWIGVIGIAAAGAFYMGRSGNQSTPSVNAEQAPQSASPAAASTNAAAQPEAPSQGARPTVAEQTASAGSAPTPPAVVAPTAPSNAAPTTAAPAEALTQPAAAPGAPQPADPTAATTPTQAPTTGATIGAVGAAVDQGARPATTGASSTGEAERGARRATSTPSGSSAAAEPRSNNEGRPGAAEPARPPSNAAASPARPATPQTREPAPTTAATATAPANAPRGGAASGGASAGAAAPAAAATAAPAGRARSVEELMRAATGADRAESAAAQRNQTAAAQSAALPPQLTTTMVRSTMGPFNSQVRACAQGQTGSATAVITVSGDGSVQNVVVSSPWGSGPNDCISNRLRTARFPAVQRPTSRVVVPFQINPSQPGG